MNKPVHLTPFTPILEAARSINRSKTTYYDMQNPKSVRHDPDLPVPFKIGRSTFVVTAELEQYIQKKIASRGAAQ
ncbi:helix-turn-helix transcriptional regulator [Ralstonia insidiosa]|uniref:helix-turn-helix transcriptional regulator n=1 Tax=Ralstonia insidiosa TaxID=190721 RepID=UPI000CEDABA8|nr:hypothetical protein [Ralstonia insidiosa]